ncbi:MAG: hypothetical protein CVV50_03725 [Spirochaetae bacterium HGW-Spirochaetae-6]|nr:MAG: hypothetical protein CVV50_03725 [Spirochaetae bacterium HGW-Spirochaetae-6]
MQAVIMAAGLGSRLKDLTLDRPKAMVSVAGRPLIDYALDFLDFPEFEEIFIVGGYKNEVLFEHVANRPKVKCLVNADFEKGSTLTLKTGLSHIKDSFLLMNVDHIYPRALCQKILAHRAADKIIAMVDTDRNLVDDDMKVQFRSGKEINTISKQLTDFHAGYIGMTFVGEKQLTLYKKSVNEVIRQTRSQGNAEAVLDYLAKQGLSVQTLDLSGFGWHEVDDQNDRLKAEQALQ